MKICFVNLYCETTFLTLHYTAFCPPSDPSSMDHESQVLLQTAMAYKRLLTAYSVLERLSAAPPPYQEPDQEITTAVGFQSVQDAWCIMRVVVVIFYCSMECHTTLITLLKMAGCSSTSSLGFFTSLHFLLRIVVD